MDLFVLIENHLRNKGQCLAEVASGGIRQAEQLAIGKVIAAGRLGGVHGGGRVSNFHALMEFLHVPKLYLNIGRLRGLEFRQQSAVEARLFH